MADRAAVGAQRGGAELREGFVVREVLFDGDRVTGVRGRGPDGSEAISARNAVAMGGISETPRAVPSAF